MKFWTKIEKKRRKYINKFYRKFKDELYKIAQPVMDYLDINSDLDNLLSTLPALIRTDHLNQTLIELYGEVGADFAMSLTDFIERRNKSLVQNILNKKLEPEAVTWEQQMEQWAMFEAGEKILSINTYAKEEIELMIREVMAQGIEQGLGRDQIAANLKKRLPGEWKRGTTWKARRIAQTEVIGASNRASFEAAKDLGYAMNKKWITAPLGVSKTERHNLPGAVAERVIPLDQRFMVDGGMGYQAMECPGDSSAGPENVINCKCTMTYEVI